MHELNDETIQQIIFTLKGLDVRGFDSMDSLVGLVMLFDKLLKSPPKGVEIVNDQS